MRWIFCLILVLAPFILKAEKLPFNTVFKGEAEFEKLMETGRKENWVALPLADRTVKMGLELCGTPYVNYTLEIDDRIEAVSVNMLGMDCWTFFEIALNSARLLTYPIKRQTPQALLDLIEQERYRNGVCTGSYLSRIHHLEELFLDNEKRGLLKNITSELGGVRIKREVREMTVGWKGYRYMVQDPSIRLQIAEMERGITNMKVVHVPKNRVSLIEAKLQNGDVVAITSRYDGGYTSHVGLAYRDKLGVLRFMHASSKHKKVLVDVRLSEYLNQFSSHAGIVVARPLEQIENTSVALTDLSLPSKNP